MKLKRLGFKKKPIPTTDTPLLKDETLPNPDQQQPGWLKGWHAGEQHFTENFIRGRVASGVTV